MAGKSFFQQHKHRVITGLVNAERAGICTNCLKYVSKANLYHRWCPRCMEHWRATADPVMLEQLRRFACAPSTCLPAPSARKVDQITEQIVAPKNDKEFLPLLLFLGNHTVGRVQALWNFVKTMEALELKNSGEVFRLTAASHDLTHRCGLHAPVQKSTLDGFLSRLFYAQNFKPLERDQHLQDYLHWFIEQSHICLYPRTRISEHAVWKTKQAWRHHGKAKPLTRFWPFLQDEQAPDHEAILMVDGVIPKGIPEQWRQDMCQDLMVAMLSGEVSADNLRDIAPFYIKKVWHEHPLKYGAFSLDAPLYTGEARTLSEMLAEVLLDEACSGDEPEAVDEPRAGFPLGEVLRAKHGGIAINGLRLPEEDQMDPEIAEVYFADRRGKFKSTHSRINDMNHA